MDKLYHSLWKYLITFFLTLTLIACSKITQSNFDKIQPNMTMQEVTAILGEPSNSDSLNIAGISGTSAVWKDKNAEISIQFLNNRVTIKVFNKATGAKKSEEDTDTNE